MENIGLYQFTWSEFLFIFLALLLSYFVLQFFNNLLARSSFSENIPSLVRNLIHNLLLIFEPLAILLLSVIFILINPLFHGLLMTLLLLALFAQVRNYLSGRVVLLNGIITEGVELRTRTVQGIVNAMRHLGLQIQTNEGLHFIYYNQLLSEGYTILSGEEIGGFYHLAIDLKEEEKKSINPTIHLMDLLATTPYIDPNHKPELKEIYEPVHQVEAQILIREDSQLQELLALIREWGYSCRVIA